MTAQPLHHKTATPWWRQWLRNGKSQDKLSDDGQPLLRELLSLEQLKRHAKALAQRHEIGTGPGRHRLIPRLAENEKVLLHAYDVLTNCTKEKQRISPAGEWLLDNFHLIEEQIRLVRRHLPVNYSRELPHLINSGATGLPRVYDIALEVIAHVDGRVDRENLTTFVEAYQQIAPLKLGEFWAIPIMLRLALIENLRRVATRVVVGIHDRNIAMHWTQKMLHCADHDPQNLLLVVADMARSNPPMSNSFVAELVRSLQGHTPLLDIPLTWISHQLHVHAKTTQQTIQLESQQQAANQVSVGASIGSLRFLGAMDWKSFVESLSPVEQELRRDPSQTYSQMTFETRDRYRHVVEQIAKRSGAAEWDVAKKAVDLSSQFRNGADAERPRVRHVGYYLMDQGLRDLEGHFPGYSHVLLRLGRALRHLRLTLFLGATALATGLLSSLILARLVNPDVSLSTLAMIFCVTILCSSQVATALTNWISTTLTKPKLLPKMDYSAQIPEECRTIVVVPSMLLSVQHIEHLLSGLEVRYLSNRDPSLHFALLTDFADASSAEMPQDQLLCDTVRQGIERLNHQYGKTRTKGDIFYLFHRPRILNPAEKVWMGFERKRGKLEALNGFLRGNSSQAFSIVVGDQTVLPTVKYVITLDSDTQLPLEAAHKLVGTLAHPLNQPRIDPNSGLVCEGYGILQPRVAINLPGANRSWYVRLYGGEAGTDPYTRAVSDVYQDVFEQGSFIGKGIYDVDAFSKALLGRLPENLILSHDLIEGCYARCGLVSDVILYEEHPSHFVDDAKRRKRWVRGDWQIIFWLLPFVPGIDRRWKRNPLSWLSKWKISDNLRRSLVPVATTVLLVTGWATLSAHWYLTAVVTSVFFIPALLTSLTDLIRKSPEALIRPHLREVFNSFVARLTRAFLTITFLPYDSAANVDAIIRSLSRMFVTKRHLLEWKSAGDFRNAQGMKPRDFFRAMWTAPIFAAIILGSLTATHPDALYSALPFLVLWVTSPAVAFFLSRELATPQTMPNPMQMQSLHRVARKTWRFFETFVGPDDNWLPPDNYQEFPTEVIAHRTSPTNIGLSLIANLSAYDFGYVSGITLVERTRKSLQTMEKLERFRGHFYNWYDTQSLRPLPPQYVSTVDSGNLCGFLMTLGRGLSALPNELLVPQQVWQGLKDTLALLLEALPIHHSADSSLKNLQQRLNSPVSSLSWALATFQVLQNEITTLKQELENTDDPTVQWAFHALSAQADDCLATSIASLAPWRLLSEPPTGTWDQPPFDLDAILTLTEVAKLGHNTLPKIDDSLNRVASPAARAWLTLLHQAVREASDRAAQVITSIAGLSKQCENLANMDYEFLYDRSRHLLAIGYNATEHRRDDSFYDLLASEARLCSFVGIAQGLLPQEHWFALGRLLTTWKGEPTLISWSGSMFEYLMPLLVMPTFPQTLLDQTYRTAVERQIEYGAQRGVPWGVSESGYNLTDVHLNYQYRAFGVPGLGLKRGLADDLVLAPYASVMALMVAPKAACENMERMTRLGYEGRYGFFEAVDFTPSRLAGQKSVIIRSFMAHHQGMSFLSLAQVLLGPKMQERFQSDPLFRAAELLLHERVPKTATIYPHAPEVSDAARVAESPSAILRVINTPDTSRPEVHLLSNSRYSVMITNSGGGYSRWKDLAITRWREDPTSDNWGSFCYVRDVESGSMWSSAHQPTLVDADHYEAIFPQAKAEFRRRDQEIELHTEITVSPEDDIELRRFSLTNRSSRKRFIELTTYAEVVLATQGADEAHPAFSNLFVQTEILPDHQAILCTRRPRSDTETTPTLIHVMSVHGAAIGQMTYETDRTKFIGRGRSSDNPIALASNESPNTNEGLTHALSGTDGSVLDPIIAIRCCIAVEPEHTVRVHVVTGVGETRAAALELAEKYRDRHVADRVFELAWTHRQVELRQLNVTEMHAQVYARLANYVIYTNPSRRASSSILEKNRRGQSGLWSYGISGDLPILMLKIATGDNLEIVRQMIQAHGYIRRLGLLTDLVIWIEEESGYRQVLVEQTMSLIAAGDAQGLVDHSGGIFVRRADQMSQEDRILVQTVARAIFSGNEGTLAEQIERRPRAQALVPPLIISRRPGFDETGVSIVSPEPDPQTLLFPHSLGGFSPDGREYRITTTRSALTPAPWSNVLANPHFGSVISESGSAYTWCENAHEFRLTPWENDALSDRSGEAFYLRDEESGAFWSPTPLPARADSPYETCHGFGYSTFRHTSAGIASFMTTFVAIDAPVKITMIKLKNTSQRTRRISVTGYCEWVLGELRARSIMHVTSEIDPTNGAVLAHNPYHPEFAGRIAFFTVSENERTVTADRSEFLGRNGSLRNPLAMYKARLSGKTGAAMDSCAAVQTVLEIESGEERIVTFVLGVGRDEEDTRTLIRRFGTKSAAFLALDEVTEFWQSSIEAVQIKTPDPAVDVLANGWLTYQGLACRIWARSGYYQSGGAYGFRDQLQDAMALLHTKPRLLREHLLRCAARQFPEGDVQHWWHPPSGRGVRTRFSDDYLWLPLATSRYVLSVGDIGVLESRVPFILGREVKPDEEAYSDLPTQSEETATLYEHCVRAINRSFKFGEHGLPLMGCGDWNDGMNLVGQHGKGESAWLAFFLFEVLTQFIRVAELQGDNPFAELCKKQAGMLSANIEKNGWDGKWYKRAFFDDGQPLGSSANSECQIDSLPQSWAVLTGAGDLERARLGMAAVDERLVDRKNQLVKLFDPPFDRSEMNPGYIKGYVPGVRENGGQYTHAAIWSAMAFAALGNRNRAWELFTMINPVNHTREAEDVAKYKVEPYVVAADVYAVSPHAGRGGWTWYTGSAGWMYRLILESLLGVRLEVDRLHFAPVVPEHWDHFEIRYRYRNTFFNITLKPATAEADKGSITVDGDDVVGPGLLLVDDLVDHVVEVLF